MGQADGRSEGRVEKSRGFCSAYHCPGSPHTSRRELSKWRARQLEVSKHGNEQLERVAKGNQENESVYGRISLQLWGTADGTLGWPDCSPLNQDLG